MSMRTMHICPDLSAVSAVSDNLDLSAYVRRCLNLITILFLNDKSCYFVLSASVLRDVFGADNGWNGPPLKGVHPDHRHMSSQHSLSSWIGLADEIGFDDTTHHVWVLLGLLRHRGNAHPVGFATNMIWLAC